MAYANLYELAGRITGDRIVAFKGRRADGVMVLMHQLTPGVDHSGVLKLAIAYMLRYPPAGGGRLLDLAELDGLTYLVTVDEAGCVELPDWLSRAVGQPVVPEAGATTEKPAANPKLAEPFQGPAVAGISPAGAETLSPRQATRPPDNRPSGLAPFDQQPVGAFTAISEPVALGGAQPEAATTRPEPLSHAQNMGAAGPESSPSILPTGGSPAASDPLGAPGIAVPTFGAPQEPETPPATYLIVQPKAGPLKNLIFALMGFVVVAALFLIAVLVVRGMR